MVYSRLFARAWRLVWQVKSLWLLGFLLGLGSISGGVARAFLGATVWPRWQRWLAQPEALLPVPDLRMVQVERFVLWSMLILFLVVIGFWLVVTVAEGSLISAVLDLEEGRPVTLAGALAKGVGWLGRFIAIDTVVFFPLFLLLLLLMVLAVVWLLGTVWLSLREGTVASLAGILLLGVVCLLPLLCLILPLNFLTVIYRTLAFRHTAVTGTGIRISIRQTWHVIRHNAGTLLVLVILLWGLQYLLNLGLNLFIIPSTIVAAVSALTAFNGDSVLAAARLAPIAMGAVVALLVIWLQALAHAFTATVWTLAYEEMLTGDEGWVVK